MKNFSVSIITAALITAGILTTLYATHSHSPQPVTEAKKKKGPGGGMEFWQAKKLGGLTAIPEGLYETWNKQSLAKKNTDVFDSIFSLGPDNVGGRTRALLIDKMNPNKVFAGAISGGLWVSPDKGQSWSVINDHAENLNITCITQDEVSPANIYYSTGEGAGNSSAAPGYGVFKSTDGGLTFAHLPATSGAAFSSTWSIRSSYINSGEIYVGTNASGMYRTTDGGQNFQRVLPFNRTVHDIETFPDGSVMCAVKNDGVYRSYTGDSGTFWKLSGLPASNIGRIELAYCQSSPNVVYAMYATGADNALNGFYASTDTGNTWTLKAPPIAGFPYAWYCFTMAVRNSNPNHIMVASLVPCYSNDGGNTWQLADDTHSDYHTIIAHPSDSMGVLVGNDGGVFAYEWSNMTVADDRNSGYRTTQFYTGTYGPNGRTNIGGLQDNGTQFSRTGISTYKHVYGGDGAYCHINLQDQNIAYMSSQNGNLRRSINMNSLNPTTSRITSGIDANQDGTIDEGAWFINSLEISPLDGGQLFFPTLRRIWRSNNEGLQWMPITGFINTGSAVQPYCIGVAAEYDPVIYVGGSGGLIYRKDSAGSTGFGNEINLRNPAPVAVKTSFISHIKVHPKNRNIIYLALSNYATTSRVWKMEYVRADSQVWTPIGGNLPANLAVNSIDVDPAKPDHVFYAGTDFGLYVTGDGGQTWTKEMDVPNVVIDQLRVRESDRTLFIFTHGRGVYIAYLKANYLGTKPVKNIAKVDIYPNPARSELYVKWPGTTTTNVNMAVYNLEGKQMFQVQQNVQEPLNVNTLPAGVYLLRIQDGSQTYTSKFIRSHE